MQRALELRQRILLPQVELHRQRCAYWLHTCEKSQQRFARSENRR
jgi:hypothetical protein